LCSLLPTEPVAAVTMLNIKAKVVPIWSRSRTGTKSALAPLFIALHCDIRTKVDIVDAAYALLECVYFFTPFFIARISSPNTDSTGLFPAGIENKTLAYILLCIRYFF
jgi:hypothetical protein